MEPTAPLIILGVIGVVLLAFFLRALFVRDTGPYAGLLTTIGILGTFSGIAWALYRFNVGDIDSSVPHLLGGMKVAFVTSVLGIFLAVILRVVHLRRSETGESAEGVPVETLLATQTAALQGIREALVGEGDTTLLSQFRLLRQEVNDHAKQLTREFREFSRTVAEQNTDALIRALEEVIRDFNTKLSEQFGENFKHLNAAVAALVEWQDKYRGQLETATRLLEEAARSTQTTAASASMEAVNGQAAILITCAQSLETTLTGIARTEAELSQRLDSFAQLGQAAKEAIPSIQTSVDRLTRGFSANVDLATNRASEVLEQQKQTVEELGRDLTRLSERNRQAIEDQVQRLDEELENALTNSLNSLGGQLATLSNRFVEDYGPLTERLRALVQATGGA